MSFADDLVADERRLNAFSSHMLKKSAADEARQRKSREVKVKRHKQENKYEIARQTFKRKPDVDPPGIEKYLSKQEKRKKKYDVVRDNYATAKRAEHNKFHEKIDKTKMIEYDL